jgi:hypothetical protein
VNHLKPIANTELQQLIKEMNRLTSGESMIKIMFKTMIKTLLGK